jgi:hypothetical protein
MRTFEVSKVDRAAKPRPAIERDPAVAALLSAPVPVEAPADDPTRYDETLVMSRPAPRRSRIEQSYMSAARLVACTDVSALVQMAHDAFYEHRPIALSPDAVWFTIAQGFANHVALHTEALRHRFVQHDGKQKLQVRREDFLLGQHNPWPEVFTAFSDQIAQHVGKLRELVVADFSTTGPLERAATEVLVMDTFQGYFEYEMLAGCGIPQITLLGTPADWRSVRQRSQVLSEYGLEPWISTLVPVLDRIIATADGADDAEFWRSFFHYESSSRGRALTGWINVLFPYLIDLKTKRPTMPNPYLAGWQQNFGRSPRCWLETFGPSLTQIPSGLASAPVIVIDGRTGDNHAMRFVAGMFGVVEDEEGTQSPEFGWAITYDR